jgi:tripartite-type tricarboxylate transporter receptor subunit TctC
MKAVSRSIVALLSMACALATAPAASQTADAYPSKPIRLIVPYSPGGGADFTARLIAQRLSANLGQQVVVENRAGANGMIGTEAVARAAPDGYTLLYADAGHSINPAVQSQVRYDAVADFSPITLIAPRRNYWSPTRRFRRVAPRTCSQCRASSRQGSRSERPAKAVART